MEEGACLRPCDQEDHYLIYRLLEFLESAQITAKSENESSNIAENGFQLFGNRYFEQSGMFKISTPRYFGILNLHKNAAGKIYDLQKRTYTFIDAGYFAEDTEGEQYSSSFVQSERRIQISESKISIEGFFNRYQRPSFSPFTFWLFRSALLFCRHPKLAFFLKTWIRSKVMTQFSITENILVKRNIVIAENFQITDTISLKNLKIKKVVRAHHFPVRYVPQSLYFAKKYLSENLSTEVAVDLELLNSTGKAEIVVL